MTAVVTILNKTAIAIAADSAVTVSGQNGHKIFNTANKIFKLSKYHPVGVAIYDSASLLTTPWEIIIKSYREQLAKDKFDTVAEYKENFMKYLLENPHFVSETAKKQAIRALLDTIIRHIDDRYANEFPNQTGPQDTLRIHLLTTLRGYVSEIIQTCGSHNPNEGLSMLPDAELNAFLQSVDLNDIRQLYNIDDPELIQLLDEAIRAYLRSESYILSKTGLVFSGYGEKEIYPAVVSINVGEVIGNYIRYSMHSTSAIDDTVVSDIIPFAQTDVIDTVLKGISPVMSTLYEKSVKTFIDQYRNLVSGLLQSQHQEVTDARASLARIDHDALISTFNAEISHAIQVSSITPTIQSVATLPKEDLAEMAESLIHMTYLKRRIMSDEESVGGPVDVAIISKVDGFIWIKRKYYFSQELNPHFFHIYYDKE